MSAGTRQFFFRREEDWKNGGVFDGVTAGPEGLACGGERGWYASAALDAGEAGKRWHRLRLDAEVPENARLDLWLLAGEAREDTDAYLSDPAVSGAEKRALFARHGRRFTNAFDLPLFSCAGRYLWFLLDFGGGGGAPVRVRSLRAEFPRTAFVDYLPQLYRRGERDSFLARFLMLFQSLYVDYEEKLERTPGLFAPAAAPGEYVAWMADWFGLRSAADWRPDALRALLPHAAAFLRRKGTCGSIRFLVERYTGEAPLLIEQFDALSRESAGEKRKTLLRLYGGSGRAFTVLVSPAAAPSPSACRALERLLRYAAPLDAVCRLAVLAGALTLDAHSYLGMNTRLPLGGGGEMELTL